MKKNILVICLTLIIMKSYSQVPSITSIAPLSGLIGSQVVISGNNFSTTPANNVVWFGATKATVVGASATSLSVTVPSGAIYSPISIHVNNLVAYSSIAFVPSFSFCGSPDVNSDSWLTGVNFGTSAKPLQSSLTFGDIDYDGKPELLVITSTNSAADSLFIFKNTSVSGTLNAGSFASKVGFAIGGSGTRILLADLDRDQKLDVIISNKNTGSGSTFHVFKNNSTQGVINAGSLSSSITFSLTNSFGYTDRIVAGDFNADGKVDLALQESNNFLVLENIGTPGSITTSSFSNDVLVQIMPPGGYAEDIAASDMDKDGKSDIVISASGAVYVIRSTSTVGSVSFGVPISFGSPSSQTRIGLADFDMDGKMDIIQNSFTNTFSIFRNNISAPGSITASSFNPAVTFTGGFNFMADLNGDGKLDIGYINNIYVNQSIPGIINSGSFSSPITLTGNYSNGAVGDIDADGMPELVSVVISSPYSVVAQKRSGIIAVQRPDICMVTVDSLSIYNEIYWDKSLYSNVDSMIIWRETTSNTYKRIGAVDGSALSMYIDTARNIGPANGNPNIGTYRYKIQIRDACGNYSLKSFWHNTVFFINSSGTFFWNEYKIEGPSFTTTNPMTQFDLVRDDFAPTGNYNTVGTVAGTQTTLNDPFYVVYQNTADWRVFAYGLTCTPLQKPSSNSGIQVQLVKSKSNIKHNFTTTDVKQLNNSSLKVMLYPNPTNNSITIELPELNDEVIIEIQNMLGELVYSLKGRFTKQIIDMSKFQNGIYSFRLSSSESHYLNKIVVQK